ncbi:M20/M25/M40 family metallo-hydrolase [uncultured Flavonifractor sp.]|uniref:M20/M25/M40 family metallo-hydrolase n=1 Tax=uncultured Flavonifractor sp. TaxID=1193534 RepID=UPI002606963D|nr:M20/M25/M40 family metallo-hydrolase [uncultured Flavonifractor sp.]
MTLLDRLGGRQAIRQGVEDTFRLLSRHPHPSHGEVLTCGDYAAFLREKLGGNPVEDHVHNLLCPLPATPGREGRPRLILQGHMDMVCAAAGDFRPEADPVSIVAKDGFLRSDGRSSLGADNGLGNAAVLWLLSTGQVAHGPLTLLFTTAEEVGLAGAKEVDPAWLAGSDYLLNTDGFHLGRAIVGSASGRRETWSRPLELEPAPPLPAWRLTLSGGLGGHSGDDIHRGRGNPIKLLSGYLAGLPGGRLAELSGGLTHNAIPAWAEAVVFAPEEPDLTLLQNALELYRQADPGLTATCAPAEGPEEVWTATFQAHVLAFLNGLYHGVYTMDPAFPGVVGASANLGKAGATEGAFQVCSFLRSARREEEQELAHRHEALAAAHGFTGTVTGYPGWPGERNNPLAAVLDRVWRAQTGRGLDIGAVHVGLEPSVFQDKCPALVMASTGPDILDAHSVDERTPLDTLPDYVLLLAGTLEAL